MVIIGAGRGGASFACALLDKQSSLKLALVEVYPLSVSTTGLSSYDNRSTALSSGTAHCYARLGIWEKILPHVTAIKRIQVSDRYLPGGTMLDSKLLAPDPLGYVVENRQLGKTLLESIMAANAIDCFAPAQVIDLKPTREGSLVCLQKEDETLEITAKLVVVAEGTESGLRSRLGIRALQHSYDQRAIICNLSVDRPHQHIAYERFTEQGPVALLPLQGMEDEPNRFALVLNSPVSESEELMGLGDSDFIGRLHQRFGYRAGRIVRVGKRFQYPLVHSVAHEQVRNGFVILGNAAHTMHPVAGQGFNLSLRDAIALADRLVIAHERGQNPGSLTVLEAYLRERQSDQMLVQQFTHGVVNLFSRAGLIPRLLRQAGLVTLDLLPTLRTEFVQFAAGMKTDVR